MLGGRFLFRMTNNYIAFCARLWYNRFMIPSDPAVLLSFVNTKLRDEYDCLDALCDDLECDRTQLEETLGAAGYRYDEPRNQFVLR